MRKDEEGIDTDRLLVGLYCSQDHPCKGDEHDKRHDDQYNIHDHLIDAVSCFNIHILPSPFLNCDRQEFSPPSA